MRYAPWHAVVPAALLLSGCTAGPEPDDAMRVRCLAPSARPQLAEAAVALSLVEPGSRPDRVRVDNRNISIPRWRDEQPEQFQRACSAMIAADRLERGGSGGASDALLAAVLSLLVAVLTAIVGGAVTSWLNGSGRRRQRANALRRAAAGLKETGDRYVAGVGGAAKIQEREVRERLDAVDTTAAEIAAIHPSWQVLRQVPVLADPPLGEGLDAWTLHHPGHAAEVARAFAIRVGTANWQAGLVERPVRSWRRLRRGPLPPADEAAELGSGVGRP